MAKKKIVIKDFSGGIGTVSEKKDVANSVRFLKNLDIYEDPSYVTLSKTATKVSGSTVVNLPLWMEDGSPYCTDRFTYDLGGNIYKETSGGVWSKLRTVSGGAGEGLKVFDDFLYYALGSELGRYGLLSGTPAFNDAFLSDGTFDLDVNDGGTGNTYATATAISETAVNRQTFTPTKDPLKAIIINVNDTGDDPNWTITVHDYYDNVIGSATILFASMATGYITFTFATPLRVKIGNEYHFHVTTTTTTGAPKVVSATSNDLEDAEFSTLFGILIDSSYHPIAVVEDTMIIGNERYLAVWDQVSYDSNKIAFDPGFEVRTIARFEEYIVIGAVKGGSATEAEESRLYFWDALPSTTASYNYYSDVSMGGPNAIHNAKGTLLGVYGNQGAVYVGGDSFQKLVDKMPKLARGKMVEVFPGAITEYNGRTLIGYSGLTDDANVEQGVFAFGKQHDYLPNAFSFPFTTSNAVTQSTALKIGLVKSIGSDLYIGWGYGATYGIDKIARTDSACASGVYEGLILDIESPDHQILPENLIIEFEALETGESITPKYRYDRAASFTDGTIENTVGATRVQLPLFNRCGEFEWGFTLASSAGTFPKITSIIFEYDDLAEEA